MRRAVPAVILAAAATPVAALDATHTMAAGVAAYARQDFAAARVAFRNLADGGSAVGETMLGTMYAHGEGGRRDAGAAAACWFRAAQRGYAPAQLALGRALAHGDGIAADRRAALMWMRLAAERGDARVATAARREAALLGGPRLPAADDVADWRPWPSGRD